MPLVRLGKVCLMGNVMSMERVSGYANCVLRDALCVCVCVCVCVHKKKENDTCRKGDHVDGKDHECPHHNPLDNIVP